MEYTTDAGLLPSDPHTPIWNAVMYDHPELLDTMKEFYGCPTCGANGCETKHDRETVSLDDLRNDMLAVIRRTAHSDSIPFYTSILNCNEYDQLNRYWSQFLRWAERNHVAVKTG